jgi:RNA polymerase sigma factor (sigma-70 family)
VAKCEFDANEWIKDQRRLLKHDPSPLGKLMLRNLPLVPYVCKRMGRVTDNDLSIAYVALWKAAQKWDPSIAKFTTLAWRSIAYDLINARIKESRLKRTAEFDPETEVEWVAVARDKDPALEAEDRLEMQSLLERLHHSDRPYMELYLSGLSIEETGERLGVSRQAAQQRIARSLKRIRERLGFAGPERLTLGQE